MSAPLEGVGTSETCRMCLRMSGDRGIPEVSARGKSDAIDPTRTSRGPSHPDNPAMVKASGTGLEPKLDKLSEPR